MDTQELHVFAVYHVIFDIYRTISFSIYYLFDMKSFKTIYSIFSVDIKTLSLSVVTLNFIDCIIRENYLGTTKKGDSMA